MNRYLFRSSASLTLVAALVFVSLAAQCSSGGGNKYVPYVKTGMRVLGKAKTIFAANGVSIGKFDEGFKVGNAAVAALESGATNAFDQIAAFIDAFESIAGDAELIKDQGTRTAVLVGLAIGSEALHELADLLQKDGSQQTGVKAMAVRRSGAAQKISAYAAKPQWRCRNSINGQFAAMEYCKAHPDTSTVERY